MVSPEYKFENRLPMVSFLEQTILAQWQVQFNRVEANNVKVYFEAFQFRLIAHDSSSDSGLAGSHCRRSWRGRRSRDNCSGVTLLAWNCNNQDWKPVWRYSDPVSSEVSSVAART